MTSPRESVPRPIYREAVEALASMQEIRLTARDGVVLTINPRPLMEVSHDAISQPAARATKLYELACLLARAPR